MRQMEQVVRLACMSPESIQSFISLAIGFAFAGAVSSGYQMLAREPASFRLLEQGPRLASFAAVPLLVFAAPFIIMRTIVFGPRRERRRFEFVTLATVVAGLWSLMSGTVLVMALETMGALPL
jgi:hypothetical protein